MKSYRFLKLFFISSLSFILMAGSCSNDDDEVTPELFEPITINIVEDMFTDCDQTYTVDNVALTYRTITLNEACNPDTAQIGECNFNPDHSISIEVNETNPFFGEYRLFLGTYLDIDISQLENTSRIRMLIGDYCGVGCTRANLYNGGEIINHTENEIYNPNTIEELVFDDLSQADRVTLYSCEAFVYQIIIE